MLVFNLRHALLLTSFVFATASHAASFDCAGASSPVEKAVCADPYTSSLDEKLGALWRTTLAHVADPQALKADQRAWLKNRSLCGADPACLAREYLMRLTELKYAPRTFSWDATWQLIPHGVNSASEVIIKRQDATHVRFGISAQEGANSGELEGVAVLNGDEARFEEGSCTLVFRAINGVLDVTQNGDDVDCSAGMGVFYSGRYVAADKPLSMNYNLLSLGLARTQQEDQAMHKLLNGDYQTLVDRTSTMTVGDPAVDVPDAEVIEMWVRGLGNMNAAILMRAASHRFWVLMLVSDKEGRTRARYYANVPEWKKRLPAQFQAWYERMEGDRALPLDFMP
ncbi:hypothetical protein C1X29_26225 [Pseudomonas sp. GW456-12-10-14-LB2]|uniref:lysozyme inhibitor LprI family protein n=1 Tax=Pseudomonas sp. GW456-12-10-14-LB2 TaxID=2070674 RepID=UPI000C9B3237|nr:hypothetical protein [Pseudomonas sp. GW456-12-10-14-LB2]PNB46838.1 hypothetical protein C1X29_26225 [Pseudomonas sp. GW456-12-10-14-LB2]